ncbi:MAG: CoA protein activase [Actinobacteria bacterium]|nr:CoA protein activase [Actinomycetota bacterium]
MKITFPHMGNSYIALSALTGSLGAEVIVPPRPTRQTIDLGALHAPEFVCLPFKVNMGDNIRALEMGSDTLAMVSGMWACRFGYYGRLQHQILRDAGYEFDSILLGRDDLRVVYNKFRSTAKGNLTLAWARAFRLFRLKAITVDCIETRARAVMPFEKERGTTTRKMKEGLSMVHAASSIDEVKKARASAVDLLDNIDLEKTGEKPLQIAIVGEIYTVLEPAINFDIERRLGEKGILVHPVMSVYKWLFRPLKVDPSITVSERRARKIAKPYVPYVLGGEEHQTITGTIDASRKGYDGVIHLYPFTCMPENICRSILPKLESKYDMPLLNLCLDEHASPTGIETRLEAFVDLLKQRRKKPHAPS